MAIFQGVIAQKNALFYLNSMLVKQQIRQSLLFEGPSGVGKKLIAKKLAHHIAAPTDIHWHEPEGKTSQHSVDSLHNLSVQAQLKGFGQKYSVFILNHAHLMSPPAANALLKTFEEPACEVVIILLTSNATQLLSTVRSRSVRIPFARLSENEVRKIVTEKGMKVSNDPLSSSILNFGRAGFALRSEEKLTRKRLKILWQISTLPLAYSQLRPLLRELESAMSRHIEKITTTYLFEKKWKEVTAIVKEQLLKSAEAKARCDLFEEIEFFSELLLGRANKKYALDLTNSSSQSPTRFLAEDLQRLQILWQRNGKISQLIESLFFNWPL